MHGGRYLRHARAARRGLHAAGLVPDPAGRPAHRRCWPCPATTTAPSGWTTPQSAGRTKTYTSPGSFTGAPRQIVLNDRLGPVEFTLLPFVRAATVRHYMPEADITDYDTAVGAALAACAPSAARRVLVAHQMVVAGVCPPQLSGSETAPLTVGTVDSIDAAQFAGFSYTALGHIHRAQRVGIDAVRYAGAPLCYHLDECGMEKSATLVRVGTRGVDEIEHAAAAPPPRHAALTRPAGQRLDARPPTPSDYIWATLTDPTPLPDAMAQLRTAYPNAMRLDYRPKVGRDLPADTDAGGARQALCSSCSRTFSPR